LALTSISQLPLIPQVNGAPNLDILANHSNGAVGNAAIGNEVQTIVFSNTPAGDFTLSVLGRTTSSIPYGSGGAALAALVEAQLEAILGDNNVAVSAPSDNDANVLTITYQNALGHRNISDTFVSASALSGGGTITIGKIVDGQVTEKIGHVTLGIGGTSADIATGANTLELTGNITTQAVGGAASSSWAAWRTR
jgi:hypothetical protein